MINNNFTLKEVIQFAKSSDLKNLDISNDMGDMINLINLSLIDIHSNLIINQGILRVPLNKNKTEYNLLDYIRD